MVGPPPGRRAGLLLARVCAAAACVGLAVGNRAVVRPLPLGAVELAEGSTLFEARRRVGLYLLGLDDDALACVYTAAANLTACAPQERWETRFRDANGTNVTAALGPPQPGYLAAGSDLKPSFRATADACELACAATDDCKALSVLYLRSEPPAGEHGCYLKTAGFHFVPEGPDGNCPSPGAPASQGKPECEPLPGEMGLGGYYGHFQGHFLSATAMLTNATHDDAVREGIRTKANTFIATLAGCMAAWAATYPAEDGYLFPYDIVAFKYLNETLPYPQFHVYSVPFYTVHKVLAGLIDQHVLAAHPTALSMAVRIADWSLLYARRALDAGGEALWQRVLGTEWGGMNEALTNLYEITGNDAYLRGARIFNHWAWSAPLAAGLDTLGGNHANTHIPELIGNAAGYLSDGNQTDLKTVDTAWAALIANHSWATGGSNAGEYWGPPGRLGDELTKFGGSTEESCTQYNVLKLARRMFTWTADSRLFDFYEKAFQNGLIGNQDRIVGSNATRYMYFLPLGGVGLQKPWGRSDYGFVCCWGSLTESMSKLGDSQFFETAESNDGRPMLLITQFEPATVSWRGMRVEVDATPGLPERVTIRIHADTHVLGIPVDIRVRSPHWTANGTTTAAVNGKAETPPVPGTWWDAPVRWWKNGDTISLWFPPTFAASPIADDRPEFAAVAAFTYGPLVLAAVDAPAGADALHPAGDWRSPATWLSRDPGSALRFTALREGGRPPLRMIPLRDVVDESYVVYFDASRSAPGAGRALASEPRPTGFLPPPPTAASSRAGS